MTRVTEDRPLLEIQRLRVVHPGPSREVRAVDGVELSVARGTTLALVGESGCGKTTLARAVMRLVPAREGRILFEGSDVVEMDRRALQAYRRRVQMVFQDPFGSLNPRLRVGEALEEVLRVHGLASDRRERRVEELLAEVGLETAMRGRYPHELSGGQRQRVGIARALSVEPELLVLDEPASALDVSIQAQLVDLLLRLQRDRDLTYLFIAHDLALVREVADRVAVMYQGRIMEVAGASLLYEDPHHPYTRVLLDAARGLWTGRASEAPPAEEVGEPTSPGEQGGMVGSCPYHARCPHPEKDEACTKGRPPLEPAGAGRSVACIKAPFPAPGGG